MGKVIYNIEDLDKYSKEIKEGINRAVIAAAFRLRDEMRNQFISKAASAYKSHTGDIAKLTSGIMIGRANADGTVKIHALGNKSDYDSYKTRFFAGGTKYRTQTKKAGKNIKPYTKGFIKSLNTIDEGMANAQTILNQYINNVLNN